MLRKSLSNRLLVGMATIATMTFIRLFILSNYVPSIVMDVWFWLQLLLSLLPVDGVVAELYGFWSGEKLIAFLIGFLPSTVVPIVAITRFGLTRFGLGGIFVYLLLGLGMGIMGFGGAKYGEDRRWGWLVGGLFVWLLLILSIIFGSS